MKKNILLVVLFFTTLLLVLPILSGKITKANPLSSTTSERLPPLIAYWSFNEGTGNQVFDGTLNKNDGTIMGGAIWTTDSIFGTALKFDGIDDKIVIIKTSSVDATKKVTIEAFVKRVSNNDGMILSKNGPYYIAIRNDSLEAGVYANDGTGNKWTFVRGTTILDKNKWYNVKMVYDGNSIRIYLNSIFEGEINKKGTMPQVSQQVHMGWGEPGQNQYFEGMLDEVRLYGE